MFEPAPPDGPVVVLKTYEVAPKNEAAFVVAMDRVRRSRQRTGAVQWRLFRSGERPNTFVEGFVVRSWDEHLHQHVIRQTRQDLLAEQEVDKYVVGEPKLEHLIAVN